jgi:hypothetical protein
MYVVIQEFHDLEDVKMTKAGPVYHHYMPGDIYPRPGADFKQARADVLASDENLQGHPLIGKVVVTVQEQPAETEPKTEAPKTEEQPKPKRKRRTTTKKKKAVE